MATADPRLQRLRRALVAGGCVIERGHRHDIVRAPDGRRIVTLPVSPSDARCILNCRADARRALRGLGLDALAETI